MFVNNKHNNKRRKLIDTVNNPLSNFGLKHGINKNKAVIVNSVTGYRITTPVYSEFTLCSHVYDFEYKSGTVFRCAKCYKEKSKFALPDHVERYCLSCHRSYPIGHTCTRSLCQNDKCNKQMSPNNFGYCKTHMNPPLYQKAVIEILEEFVCTDLARYVIFPYMQVYSVEEQMKYPEYQDDYEKEKWKRKQKQRRSERLKQIKKQKILI